jgi:hypothetical protein
MFYQRKLENELYAVALNFSSHKIKLPKKARGFLSGTLVISSAGQTEPGGVLLPWEGVLMKLCPDSA